MGSELFLPSTKKNDPAFQRVLTMLDRLDVVATKEYSGKSKSMTVHPLKGRAFMLEVEHPGGGGSSYDSYARFISQMQLWCIIHGYLHVDSKCAIGLPTIWNTNERLRGKVSSCQHIDGTVHEIVVNFEQKVDLRHFLGPGSNLDVAALEAINPEELVGAVLLVDDQEAEYRLLNHHLRQTRLNLCWAGSLPQMHEHVQQGGLDLVLLDGDFLGRPVKELLEIIRKAGFAGPVVVLYAKNAVLRLEDENEIGTTTFLAKPYAVPQLLGVLNKFVGSEAQNQIGDVIVSELAADPEVGELLAWYLNTLRNVSRELREKSATPDLQEVRKLCQFLRETGTGYGYAVLTSAAEAAVAALDASSSVKESMPQIWHVQTIINKLRAGETKHGQIQSNAG